MPLNLEKLFILLEFSNVYLSSKEFAVLEVR